MRSAGSGKSYAIKSFHVVDGQPHDVDALPYRNVLVQASEELDLWSLGALAFYLLAGEPLVPATPVGSWDATVASSISTMAELVSSAGARRMCTLGSPARSTHVPAHAFAPPAVGSGLGAPAARAAYEKKAASARRIFLACA